MSVASRNNQFWKTKQYGRRKPVGSAPDENVLSADGGAINMLAAGDLISHSGGEVGTIIDNYEAVIPVENDDPGRVRVANSGSRKFLPKMLTLLRRKFAYRAPSKEELALMDDKQQLVALYPLLSKEAVAAEKRVINCLTRMNICFISHKNNRDVIRRVTLDKILCGLNLTYFHIDTNRLPHGVSIGQLQDQDVVNNLSVAVGHKINYRWNENSGCWYILERASGTMGIPDHVNLMDMWERTPVSKDSLTIPIGLGQNQKVIYESLDEMVHLLIAGTTGGGKSNFLNVILCTLIRRNNPNRLRLLLVDLKGGLEFNYYDGIPHLLPTPMAPTGIVYERDGVAPLLDWVIGEGERRMGILLKATCKNIGEFNAHKTTNRMPFLVVVIDEWADVKLGKDGRDTEDKLANSVQRMRAVGIHVIVCTQVPQSIVLGTLIKTNLPAKFAFNCADLQGSMSILNNGHALNLKPKGRVIFRYQNELEVQTPFIPKNIIQETVRGAIQGHFDDVAKCDVTQEEVREWALRENNGWLALAAIYLKYKNRGLSKHAVEDWLKEFQDNDYLIGSTTYHVTPFDNNHPRRLVAKKEDE